MIADLGIKADLANGCWNAKHAELQIVRVKTKRIAYLLTLVCDQGDDIVS